MNIHPLLVHFPVALFVIYALIEITCLDRKFKSLKNGKRFLSVVAFLTAIATLATGETAEHALGQDLSPDLRKLIETHSALADVFVIVAGIIALVHFAGWTMEKYPVAIAGWQKIAHRLSALNKRGILMTLAIIGFLLITIVGGLGGLIVYGPTLDPMTKLLYSVVVGK